MRVSLLGTISASTERGRVAISGDKQQTLLAMLALAAPRSVSDDRLIDELWGDEPPRIAPNALQAQVSTLRRTLGRDTVRRASGGYLLAVDPADVDALRLEEVVRRGREAAAAGDQREAGRCFEEAVALVREAPVGELTGGRLLGGATAWLQDLVLDAHEGLVDSLLASSRHAEVIESLRSLVAEHPLRERFHAQLMIALYRCGRQSEALRSYRQARGVLLDELGLDPGPELQMLERAVLCHDPALAAPIALAPASSATLPPSLTSFVGRDVELATLHAAMAAARLVTVVGPAGVGKSRLVLEVAGELASTREVWYVELAPVTDPMAVPEAVASTVGARVETVADTASASRRQDERTIDRLGDRPAVLVLDNCEHVIDAAASFVRTILAGCRALTIVATSREPLAVDGERQVVLGTLHHDDAMELFAHRARAVQPLFLDGDDEGNLREVCRRLDGLPLALELAAARVKTLPLPEILRRLEHRFELLTTSERHVSPRHRALRAALDGSYDLLFDEEQRLFRTLAVFAGGITVDAAEDVFGPGALDVLTSLADRSMIVADTSADEARFKMLESVRQYGVERLRELGEHDAAVAAHVAWCTRLAEAADEAIRGPGQLDALARLDVEHDNLRAALAHCSVADPNAGLRLIGALLMAWFARDHRQEARHWAEACLAGASDPSPADLVRVLAGVGLMPESSGWTGVRGELESELHLAEARQRRGIALGAQLGHDVLVARCQLTLITTLARSVASRLTVDPKEVRALVAEAVGTFEEAGEHFFASLTRNREAIWYLVAGDVHAAERALESARCFAVRSGDHWSTSSVEWIAGMLLDAAGDAAGAYRHVERSLRRFDELGMGDVVVGQARALAQLADRGGEVALAAQWRSFADRRSGTSTGGRYDGSILGAISNRIGLDARREGRHERARRAHLDAHSWYREVGVTPGSAFTESCLGFLAAELGDAAAAAGHHAQALDDAEAIGDPDALALALEGAAASFADGEGRWAAGLLAAARALREDAGHEPETHRDDVDAVERRVRAELGDDAFAAATLRGAGLTRVEAIAAARRHRSG